MKSSSASTPILFVLTVLFAGLWIKEKTHHYLQLNGVATQIAKLQESQGIIQKTLLRTLKSEATEPARYFLKDFKEHFNVEPKNHLIIPDELQEVIKTHNVSNDEAFQDYPETVKKDTDLFNGYLDRPEGGTKQMYIQWSSKEIGYGCFANINMPAGTFLGEYSGVLTSEEVNTDYMWSYMFQDEEGKYPFSIDGRYVGNLLRFVNHAEETQNVRTAYQVKDGVWRLSYVLTKSVRKGDELFAHYGSGYWESRQYHEPSKINDRVK